MSGRNLPWFRLYIETVDDEKIRLLAFEDRWHYIALLCCKGQGLLDAGDDRGMLERKLAVKLGLQLRELETVAMRLAEVGLIDSETFQPLGWDARQYQSDSSRERTRAWRERRRAAAAAPAPISRGDVTVTAQDTDTDADTDQEPEQKQKPPRKRGRAAGALIDLPDWVPRELWDAWIEVRQKIRAPNTAQALRLNLGKLEACRAAGQDPAAVLEQAVSRGWRAIFPLKDHPHDRDHRSGSGRLSAVERVKRANADAGFADA